MPTRHVEQAGGFARGAISRRFWYGSRTVDEYQSAADELTNLIPTPSGNLVKRPYTEVVQTLASGGEGLPGRIIPWTLLSGDSVLIAIHGSSLTVFADGSVSGRRRMVENEEMDEGWAYWGTLSGPDNNTTGTVGGDNYIEDVVYGPIFPIGISQYTLGAPADPSTATFRARVSPFYRHRDDPFVWRGPDQTVNATLLDSGGNPVWAKGWDGLDSTLGEVHVLEESFDASFLNPGEQYQLIVSCQINVHGEPINQLYGHLRVYECSLVVTGSTAAEPIFTNPWEDCTEVQYVQNPYEDQMVFTHNDVAVQELTFDGTDWILQPLPFADPAPEFGDGFPACCTSIQGRLVLGNSRAFGSRSWASEPGDWYAFDDGTDKDGLEFTLTERGNIHWMFGHKELMIGTQYSEHEVSASSGLLSKADIQARIQSNAGGAKVQPTSGGRQVFFASADRRTLRSVDLLRDHQGWVSPEHSFWNDACLSAGVRRVVYCRMPYPMVVCLLRNGQVWCYLYEEGIDVSGWFEWQFLNGIAVDICVIQNDGQDRLTFLCDTPQGQVISTVLNPQLPRINYGANNIGVDHWQLAESETATDQWVTAPGAVVTLHNAAFGDVTTIADENGIATVPIPVAAVWWGYNFMSRMVSVPLANFRGTRHDAVRSFSTLGIRISSYTTDGEKELLINGQTPTVLTQDGSFALLETRVRGHDRLGQVTIEDVSTNPLNIVTLYGTAEVDSL